MKKHCTFLKKSLVIAVEMLAVLGIVPDTPATGYGYICAGKKLDNGFYQVESFKEKPDFETARKYLENGNYWWNCGIFVWSAAAIVKAFEQFVPELHEKIIQWSNGGNYQEDFANCTKISNRLSTTIRTIRWSNFI